MQNALRILVLAAFAATGLAIAQATEKPKLVTIVGTGEPQVQLMSMVLTMQSLKQGAKVHVLLCGPGGDLALKDAPASATTAQKPKGMSPQGLMKKVMAAGATVEVCAIYLPNKGLDKSALIEGVGAAKPPEMAARLIADHTRIMSF